MAGADVRIVFMTDGCRSHAQLMAPEDLRLIRSREALAACRVLGLNEACVTFLGFGDGNLSAEVEVAIERVAEILQDFAPREVYIPYHLDGPSDHVATNLIVRHALHKCIYQITVNEYPIWFWHHWPWVGLPIQRRRNAGRIIRTTIAAGFGIRMVQEFRYGIRIGDVLDQKKEALAQYRSQTTRLLPDERWTTLEDVSDGDWLALFFQDYEVFHRYCYQ